MKEDIKMHQQRVLKTAEDTHQNIYNTTLDIDSKTFKYIMLREISDTLDEIKTAQKAEPTISLQWAFKQVTEKRKQAHASRSEENDVNIALKDVQAAIKTAYLTNIAKENLQERNEYI